MVGSADTGEASDSGRMFNAQAEALRDDRGGAIIVPRGRRPPREQIELEPAMEVVVAMSCLNCYLLHSEKSYL